MQAAPPVTAPIVVSTIQTSQRQEQYMSKCVLVLSVTQIIIGVLCILLQLVLTGVLSPIFFVGQGIWAGLFFILTGSFGIVSTKRKTECFIVAFLSLAIISVITTGILATSSIEIVIAMDDPNSDHYGVNASKDTVIGINAVLIIMAVTQAMLAIISSAFSCHGLSGNGYQVMAGTVQCTRGPDGQQQMVIVPFSQQGAVLPAGPSFDPVLTELPDYAYDQMSPPNI